MLTLTHRYEPRGNALRLLRERTPEVLLSGPAGTGKSRACLEKLHLLMMVNPNARGLIVRKTQVSLTNTALETFRQHVVAQALVSGEVTWYGGSAQEPPQYRYANGSKVTICGMDKATRIMSSEYDVIYVQEATELTLHDWQALITRLRNGVISFQQLMADCNPSTPTHWLKRRADTGATLMLNTRHEDNPRYYAEDGTLTEKGRAYMAGLDSLTGVDYQRLRHGRWVAAEGVIYDEWDLTTHVVDPFEIPREWTRYWAIDWGYTNPFVCQRWAIDPDGRAYLYAETYMTGRTVDVHTRNIMGEVQDNRGQWLEPKPARVICDHDSGDRAQFTKHSGLPTTPARKDVTKGIQAVQRRIRVAGDGKPRLFILRNAVREVDTSLEEAGKPVCTADEIPGYVWRDHATKEEPVKENDHGADALRYLVADQDLGGQYRVRWAR